MMRAYIAGAMRGIENYNFPAFDAARDLLSGLGHDPVSPADLDRAIGIDETSELPEDFVQGALRRDFAAILSCDAIAFLPGWETSTGAWAERRVAEAIGLPCYRIVGTEFYRESIIGVSGVARAGKDTFAGFLSVFGYEKKSLANPLKGILYDLDPRFRIGSGDEYVYGTVRQAVDSLGWERAKEYPEVRGLLQRLGTEGGRKHLWDEVWIEALFRSPSSGRIAIADVRFPNEARAVKERGGTLVRIERPGVQPANGHVSEHALADTSFDITVMNDGTLEDLAEKAADLAEALDEKAVRA